MCTCFVDGVPGVDVLRGSDGDQLGCHAKCVRGFAAARICRTGRFQRPAGNVRRTRLGSSTVRYGPRWELESSGKDKSTGGANRSVVRLDDCRFSPGGRGRWLCVWLGRGSLRPGQGDGLVDFMLFVAVRHQSAGAGSVAALVDAVFYMHGHWRHVAQRNCVGFRSLAKHLPSGTCRCDRHCGQCGNHDDVADYHFLFRNDG